MSLSNLYLTTALACTTACMFGYGTGYIGGVLALPSFTHYFGLDTLPPNARAAAESFTISLWLLGALLGVLTAIPVCSRLGRARALTLCAGTYTLGAALQAVPPSHSLAFFNTGRLVNGIGVGAGTLATPIYIAEIATPDTKGVLLAAWQVSMQGAALVGFWGGYISHTTIENGVHWQWRLPVLFQVVFGVILVVAGCGVLPESPVWLGAVGRREECRGVLQWLREEDSTNQSASLALGAEVEACCRRDLGGDDNDTPVKKSEALYAALSGSANLRRRLLCGVGLMALMTLSGSNALNFYAPTIFASAGFTSTSASLLLTGTFGLVKLGASLGFMFCFVRIKGHRFWLLLCTAICAVSFAVLAFCVRQLEPHDSNHDGATSSPLLSAIAVLAVYTFAFFFGIGHGPIAWNFCAEIFPPRLSASCCAITTCTQWVFQIVNAILTPFLLTLVGWYTWVIFCGVNVFLFVWSAAYIPETRGLPMGVEMERVFERGSLLSWGKKGRKYGYGYGLQTGDAEREPLLGNRGGDV
ncbi:general substrate transporter [Aspergillus pseudoustus]|uniref:General substrate transporter n=1 Tax=Aspergillus pseudoustus TaxID=1810923 RepID=A0ABR4ICT8_9EURO